MRLNYLGSEANIQSNTPGSKTDSFSDIDLEFNDAVINHESIMLAEYNAKNSDIIIPEEKRTIESIGTGNYETPKIDSITVSFLPFMLQDLAQRNIAGSKVDGNCGNKIHDIENIKLIGE